jgi:hypothetical protein
MEEKQDGGTLISEEHEKFLGSNNEQYGSALEFCLLIKVQCGCCRQTARLKFQIGTKIMINTD